MKPTHHASERLLLTAEDAARIRELLAERNRIVCQLRDLDGKELAAMIPIPLIDLAMRSITG
jgi:hypothetical protein